MSQQGGTPTGHEDDWWGQLYDDSADDTGPTAAADSVDDRFASAAGTVGGGVARDGTGVPAPRPATNSEPPTDSPRNPWERGSTAPPVPETSLWDEDEGEGEGSSSGASTGGPGPLRGDMADGANPPPSARRGAGTDPHLDPPSFPPTAPGNTTPPSAGQSLPPAPRDAPAAEGLPPSPAHPGTPMGARLDPPPFPPTAPGDNAPPPPPQSVHTDTQPDVPPTSSQPPAAEDVPPPPVHPGTPTDARLNPPPAPLTAPGDSPRAVDGSAPRPAPPSGGDYPPRPAPQGSRLDPPRYPPTPTAPAPPAPQTRPAGAPLPPHPQLPVPPSPHNLPALPSPPPPTPDYVGSGPPTYDAEPTALPPADPDELDDLVADTVLDGARYGTSTLRAASVRGDSARFRGEPRRDSLLTARFGSGEQALVLVAMATGARATPGAHRAAAEACHWIGRAVGRSHARLAEDIRGARRGDLKSGLHRLTDRSLGKLRASAAEQGVDPEEYSATLRCLLLPAHPECRTRVFFGVGPGGLFRLRDGEWQDIEPTVGDAIGEAVVGYGSQPAETPEGDRLTMDLGIPTPPSPYEPAPEPPREPFRFRASVARPGDTLLMCTGGLAEPLRGEPELSAHLSERWSGTTAPGLAAFLADTQVRVKGYADDRTAAAVWEA
ncbi:protein phosphatase 2C domain-containing protein [Streptomyces sp. NPDC051576]|uniref:protein phosphatase 2C domain-containing protein n=1 Tax=Streptomyces sp. NPDC051576 TaxID=3155803 RepID=UPI0034441AF4